MFYSNSMRKKNFRKLIVTGIAAVMLFSAFFSSLFVVYEYDMSPSDYQFVKTGKKPDWAEGSVWFSYGDINEDEKIGKIRRYSNDRRRRSECGNPAGI